MPYFRLPLSGDVIQAINPWHWMLKFKAVDNQVGLVNINLGRSSDPELEHQILDEVGSYGRQIGKMSEALQVLLKHVKLDQLNEDDRRKIAAFESMQAEVNKLKSRRSPPPPVA